MSAEKEVIVAESSSADDSEPLAEISKAEAPAKAPPPKAESTQTEERKQRNEIKRRGRPAADQVVAWFAACARCSFFLSAYRLEQGNDEFASATENSKAGWLSLAWSQSLCKLVRKSYGSLLDIDCYHYDGSCPDCHRQFVYQMTGDKDEASARFRVELKPRTGR